MYSLFFFFFNKLINCRDFSAKVLGFQSILNPENMIHDFQKQCSFGGERLKSFYCSNSFLFQLKKISNQVIPSHVVHILL